MTLHAPIWMEDASYLASLDRQLIDILFATGGGVFASGDGVVTQRGAGANLSVDVAALRSVVPGTDTSNQGKYICWSDAVVNVPLATAPGTGNSRWDLIIVQVRDSDAIGGSNNDFIITKVTGTAASSPSVPSTPASSYVLAKVFVGANVTTITNSNVTDMRVRATSGVAMSYASGSIGANVGLGTNTPTKVINTAALAIGTWLINFTMTSEAYNDTVSTIEVSAAVDTATAILSGCIAAGSDISDGTAVSFTEMPPMTLTFVAVVTAAGTLKFTAECAGASGGNALAATRVNNFANATGYTALKIA